MNSDIVARFPFPRTAFAAVLGILEILVLGLAFDTGNLERHSGWWVWLIDHAPQALQMLIAAAAAWCLVASSTLRRDIVTLGALLASHTRWGFYLVAHGVSFSLFCLATHQVLDGETSTTTRDLWALAWFGFGFATALFFFLTIAPGALWWRIIAGQPAALVISASVGVAAWWVGMWARQGWQPLAQKTFVLVTALLRLIYRDVVADPAELTLGTERFAVRIAPECSGYEGLGLIGVFTIVFLWFFRARLRMPRALVLLPLGMFVVWLLNSVRIAALVAIGTSWSAEIATGGFHSQAGWLVFNAVALGLVLCALRTPWLSREPTTGVAATVDPAIPTSAPLPAPGRANPPPTPAYLGPFLAVIFVSMLAGAFSPATAIGAFSWKPYLNIAVAIFVLVWQRHGLQGEVWRPSWVGFAAGVAIYLIWVGLLPARDAAEGASGLALPTSPTWSYLAVVIRLVGYVVVTPVVEELAFRGYLLRRLVRADFTEAALQPLPWFALLVSGAAFGFFHGAYWLAGTIAGVAFGWVYARRGQLGDAVLAHALTNGLLALHAWSTGNWSAWS